ncbi:redoxin domain protein [gamma proteobacterium HTCC5015]|nr:redoxin domain protein [gamma proteobacterium HTCC5015]
MSVATLSSAADRLNAESFDLDNYRGKVLYLDFWASWCGPCRASFPWMNDLRQAYGEDELAIVAINVDTNRGQAEQFLDEHGADFDVVFDQAGSLPPEFEVMGMPSAYLYSAEGELLASHIGFRQSDASEWRHTVDAALAGGQ